MNDLHQKLTIFWLVQKFPTLSGVILVFFFILQPSLDPILSQLNLAHTLTFYFFNIQL